MLYLHPFILSNVKQIKTTTIPVSQEKTEYWDLLVGKLSVTCMLIPSKLPPHV